MPAPSRCGRCGHRRTLYNGTCARCLGGRSHGNSLGSVFGKIKQKLAENRESARREFAGDREAWATEGRWLRSPALDPLFEDEAKRELALAKAKLVGVKCAYCQSRVPWGKTQCPSCGAPRALSAAEREASAGRS